MASSSPMTKKTKSPPRPPSARPIPTNQATDNSETQDTTQLPQKTALHSTQPKDKPKTSKTAPNAPKYRSSRFSKPDAAATILLDSDDAPDDVAQALLHEKHGFDQLKRRSSHIRDIPALSAREAAFDASHSSNQGPDPPTTPERQFVTSCSDSTSCPLTTITPGDNDTGSRATSCPRTTNRPHTTSCSTTTTDTTSCSSTNSCSPSTSDTHTPIDPDNNSTDAAASTDTGQTRPRKAKQNSADSHSGRGHRYLTRQRNRAVPPSTTLPTMADKHEHQPRNWRRRQPTPETRLGRHPKIALTTTTTLDTATTK